MKVDSLSVVNLVIFRLSQLPEFSQGKCAVLTEEGSILGANEGEEVDNKRNKSKRFEVVEWI